MRLANSKEIRAMVFIVVAMVMAVMLCVASITRFNVFSVVVSILMLSTLSIGLGYQYCKHEDTIGAMLEASLKEKVEKPKTVRDLIVGEMPEDRVIAKIAKKPNLMSAERREESACANDSAYHQGK